MEKELTVADLAALVQNGFASITCGITPSGHSDWYVDLGLRRYHLRRGPSAEELPETLSAFWRWEITYVEERENDG